MDNRMLQKGLLRPVKDYCFTCIGCEETIENEDAVLLHPGVHDGAYFHDLECLTLYLLTNA